MTRRHTNEGSGLAAEKTALRAAMRAVRAGIPPAERARLAATACARVLALPEMQAARTVAVYCAFGTELALDALVRELRERDDVRLVAPATLTGRRLAFVPMEAAELLARDDGSPESPGTGECLAFLAHPERPLDAIPAGKAPVDPAAIDVMLVPGLAFDKHGMRLGYGAGYYDRWLAEAPGDAVPRKRPLLIGICFDEQLVSRVSAEPHDRPVDLVVTPTRALHHTQSHKQ